MPKDPTAPFLRPALRNGHGEKGMGWREKGLPPQGYRKWTCGVRGMSTLQDGDCPVEFGRWTGRNRHNVLPLFSIPGKETGKKRAAPPPAAFPRMGGAWGKNTFLTRRARKAPGKPGAHGEAEGGGVASGALRLPCDVAGDCGEGNALSGTRFPCISPVTSRARRASSPASHPASPAFGSCEASRPIEALGLRRDVLIFQ